MINDNAIGDSDIKEERIKVKSIEILISTYF
jgi:hypothetical protein